MQIFFGFIATRKKILTIFHAVKSMGSINLELQKLKIVGDAEPAES